MNVMQIEKNQIKNNLEMLNRLQNDINPDLLMSEYYERIDKIENLNSVFDDETKFISQQSKKKFIESEIAENSIPIHHLEYIKNNLNIVCDASKQSKLILGEKISNVDRLLDDWHKSEKQWNQLNQDGQLIVNKFYK